MTLAQEPTPVWIGERGAFGYLLERLVLRMLEDLEVLAARSVVCLELQAIQGAESAEPLGQVGLVFRFTLDRLADRWPALWVLTWREVAGLAAAFDHRSDAEQASARSALAPDAEAKRRLLEMGPYLAASLEAALGEVGHGDMLARFETCLGLRADAPPRLNELPAEFAAVLPARGGQASPPAGAQPGLGQARGAGPGAERPLPWIGVRLVLSSEGFEPGPGLLMLPAAALA